MIPGLVPIGTQIPKIKIYTFDPDFLYIYVNKYVDYEFSSLRHGPLYGLVSAISHGVGDYDVYIEYFS